MRAKGFSLLGVILIGVLLALAPALSASGTTYASGTTNTVAVQPVADPTPTPTQSNPYPSGSPDSNASDYGAALWVVVAAVVAAVLIAGGTVLVIRSQRKDDAIRR
jgi:hypothetical protein